jgi:hypothetical protein
MRIFPLIPLLLALAFVPARATSEYNYGKNEYVIIRNGLAPNGQMSLASHSDGDGNESFHVWLMAEPEHRKIVVLPGIGSDNNLDTAADAYRADWSKDSHHVAVLFRSSRQQFEYNLYGIEGRNLRPIRTPNLFREVTSRDVGNDDDERRRIWMIDWRDGKRVVLREYRTFVISDPDFLRLLGAYGRVAEKLDGGKLYVTFAADADCVFEPGRGYHVVNIRPGDQDHPPIW